MGLASARTDSHACSCTVLLQVAFASSHVGPKFSQNSRTTTLGASPFTAVSDLQN